MERPPVEIEEAVYLPNDLSDWVAKSQLREWIVERVNSFNWNNAELIELLRRNPEFKPKALLSTIALAYLTGTFSGEDIVRACSRDPEFRSVRPEMAPRAQEFSIFRKLNRVLIQDVLQHVTTEVLKSHFIDADDFTILPAGLRRMVVENAGERLNIARHMDRSHEG